MGGVRPWLNITIIIGSLLSGKVTYDMLQNVEAIITTAVTTVIGVKVNISSVIGTDHIVIISNTVTIFYQCKNSDNMGFHSYYTHDLKLDNGE